MYKFYYTIINNGTVIVNNQMCYADSENELYNDLKEYYNDCEILIN